MKNKIKHILVLLVMIGIGFSVKGKSVDETTAKMIGSNFLISKGVQGVKSASDLTTAYIATAVIRGNTVNDYYVFNVTGTKAFVMVSGDDIIIPVLAYSGEASFDITLISPSAKDWIDGYKNQITYAITNSIQPKSGTADSWNELKSTTNLKAGRTTGVTPLVSTTWDQDAGGTIPYNYLCPNTTASGGLSVTGCVATAMAQLMKYWNWPTVGCGSHTYYDTSSKATLTADFGNTVYQWSSMPSSSSNLAVATLMFHAGISVNMNHTASESGSWVLSQESYGTPFNAAYALKTYFHYKPTMQSIPRYGEYGGYFIYYGGIYSTNLDSIAQSTWVTMLQTELSAGRPIIYTGQGSLGGHCWICDGWISSADMFHFNWGWSGTGPDGYYTVDDLAPPLLGVGGGGGDFNEDQGVIMGLQPDSFPSNAGNIQLLAHLNTTTSSPMPYGSPLSITTKILNSGSTAFTGSFCALVYDTGNNVVDTVAILNDQTIAAGDSTASLTFDNTTGMFGVIPVSYHSIRVLYRPSSSTTWTPVANNGDFYNYTILDVLNDTDIALFDSLHVGPHTILQGKPVSVFTTIGNQGSVNFNGSLQAVLINTTTDSVYVVEKLTGKTINYYYAYGTFTFTNSSLSLPAGTYALEIQHQYDGAGSFYITGSDFYANPVLIKIVTPASAGVATVIALTNDITVYPNPASDAVNFALQGTGITDISIIDIQGRILTATKVTNQSVITLPVSDFAPGIYFVQAQTNSGTITKKIVIAK